MKSKSLQLSLVIVSSLFGIGSVNAGVIISDSFTGTGQLRGRTPDGVDLPASTYSVTNGGGGIDSSTGSPLPSANTNYNSAAFLNISSTGNYTKPSLLTLILDLKINSIQDGGSEVRGIGLGFFTAIPDDAADASTTFTGLTVRPNGDLQFVRQGVQQPITVAAFPGFSPANFYTLTYSIDTTTGSITNVNFNGNDDTATFSGVTSAGAFTPAITNQVGFYGDTANSVGFSGRVDNFFVSSPVPEASTTLFGVIGAAGILFRRTRNGRNA